MGTRRVAKKTAITLADMQRPELLFQRVQALNERITQLELDRGQPVVAEDVTSKLLRMILQSAQQQLKASGEYPLNVEALMGVLAQAQLGKTVVGNDLPTSPSAELYDAYALGIKPGTPATLYYVAPGVPKTWTEIGQTNNTAGNMTTDTPQNVTATKTFDADQIFTEDVLLQGIANAIPKIQLSEADFTEKATIQEIDGVLNIAVNAAYDGANWNRENVAKGSWRIEMPPNGTFTVHRALADANPIGTWYGYFSVNAAALTTVLGALAVGSTATISGQLLLNRIGAALLIKPSAAGTAADTKMIEVQDDTGASKANIDIEGDATFNALSVNSTSGHTGQANYYGGLYVEGQVNIQDALSFYPFAASGTPYAIGTDGVLISYSQSATAAGQITLPSTGIDGRLIIIYDQDQNAAVNNITVKVPASNYLDGVFNGTYVISTNGQRKMFIRTAGNVWWSLN